MTAAPDSPRPWNTHGHGVYAVYDARDLWCGYLRGPEEVNLVLRAVNNYDKMREALEKITSQKRTNELETACDVEYADFEQGYDDIIAIARAILKEIDNGR